MSLADSPDDDQWPPRVSHKIFRLAMIKTEQEWKAHTDNDLVREKTITGKVDNVLLCKVPIELKDVFKEIKKDQRRLVLMEGAPGSGKSTLSLFVCQQWTAGRLFQEYKLAILVRLRELVIQNAKNISELLPRQTESMGQRISDEIISSNGKDILFILDGWNELPHNYQDQTACHS